MYDRGTGLVRLYLPLLTHDDIEVRRHAATLLTLTVGPEALAALRRLAQDSDREVRRQAQVAIDALARIDGRSLEGMPEAGLQVTCLGALRVRAAGGWIDMRAWSPPEGGRAGWQKVQAAFAYLVHCERHGTSRKDLGEAVWGAAASPSSLNRTLTTLRQALVRGAGQDLARRVLIADDERCMLDPQLYETDVAVFERVYALAYDAEHSAGLGAAAPLYAQALDLYTGPYMADVTLGSGWMMGRRALLSSYCLLAAERLAEHAYELGDYRRCVLVCLQALGADPAADDIVIWMLRAYARLGHYGELEHAFRGYLRAAGLDPSDAAVRQDPVLRTYEQLVRTRSVNE